MAEIKRFRIFNSDEQILVGKYATTLEAYGAMKKLNHGLAHYFIDDVVDDIEVSSDEFIEAFERGEHPIDLQRF